MKVKLPARYSFCAAAAAAAGDWWRWCQSVSRQSSSSGSSSSSSSIETADGTIIWISSSSDTPLLLWYHHIIAMPCVPTMWILKAAQNVAGCRCCCYYCCVSQLLSPVTRACLCLLQLLTGFPGRLAGWTFIYTTTSTMDLIHNIYNNVKQAQASKQSKLIHEKGIWRAVKII